MDARATLDERMELNRQDVLELLSIASGPTENDLQRLLSFFTARNPIVRFASLWRVNKCNDSISIVARSEVESSSQQRADKKLGDYRPQLPADGTGEQEFICESDTPSITHILQSNEFSHLNRKNCSIIESGIYDKFHPEEIVEEYGLDHFVALPISVKHQPDESIPRYMCLLYCYPGKKSSEVRDVDLELIYKCVGNLIYNVFSHNRQITTTRLTQFLTSHHTQDEQPLLDFLLKYCVSCEGVFSIGREQGPTNKFKVVGSKFNSVTVSQGFAKILWNLSTDDSPLKLKNSNLPRKDGIRSALIFQPSSNEVENKTVFVFCNKKTPCPLRDPDGGEFFISDFGFDDVELMTDVGAHLKAFTETVGEEKRRNDLLRIVAHETKQPALDMWNAISSHRRFPESDMFSAQRTLNVVEENAELSFALAEMNMDFGGSSIQIQTSPDCAPTEINVLMKRFRNALNSFCDDSDFNSKNITIDVEKTCRSVRIQKSVISAFFINMVTNAIKYNHRVEDDGWCSVRVQWVFGPNDPIWKQINYHSSKVQQGLLISVADNGRGISPGNLHRVFERNFREQEDGVRGLGLGLFRVAEIVKAYGGDIWATSITPHIDPELTTTRFGLVLPRSKVAL